MIYVTKHAVERYIERVMEVDASKDEIEDMVNKLGGFIAMNINNMISNKDVGFRTLLKNETYHVIYRDICFILRAGNNRGHNMAVVTLYRIEVEDFIDGENRYEYINKIISIISEIQMEIAKICFKDDKRDVVKSWENRIMQYSQLLFNNPMSQITEGDD